jgi:hypothetical protein
MVVDDRGSYRKLEKRPAKMGLFVVLGGGEQDDCFYPRGILHREGAGRSWAIEKHLKYPWGGVKTKKVRSNTE